MEILLQEGQLLRMAKVATNPVLRGVFSKEPKMIADVEYDGDVKDDEETPLVVTRRRSL